MTQRGPIIVSSPVQRCGTTLMQRLLASSPDVCMYGESLGSQFRDMVLSGLMQVQVSRSRPTGTSLTDWDPTGPAPAEAVSQIWGGAVRHAANVMQRQSGDKAWGFKYPALEPVVLETLLHLLPDARVVYMVRDPYDAMASAKGRAWIKDTEDVRNFARSYKENLQKVKLRPKDIQVSYENLISSPYDMISALEHILGIENISHNPLDTKVNTFRGTKEGRSDTQYVEPVALTDEEKAAAKEILGG